MRRAHLLFLIFISICFYVASALAGEVRVVDQDGLVRALKVTESPVRVFVRASKDLNDMVLSPVGGIQSEFSAEPLREGTIQFRNVTKGTWKLSASSKDIIEVAIEEELKDGTELR